MCEFELIEDDEMKMMMFEVIVLVTVSPIRSPSDIHRWLGEARKLRPFIQNDKNN